LTSCLCFTNLQQWELIATEPRCKIATEEEADAVQLEYNEIEVSDKDLHHDDGVTVVDVSGTNDDIELAN
jgi:hypothetical protein